jgi:acyl carrier protein
MILEEIGTRLAAEIHRRFAIRIAEAEYATPLTEIDGLEYDSLRALELIDLVEEAFDIRIDFMTDDVQHSFSTMTEIISLVHRKCRLPAAV